MKRPHLARVAEAASVFTDLVAAATAAGLRVGWLDLETADEAPAALAEAADAGALRAVAVTAGGSVAVKRRTGTWVLDDLLREHFLGCRLVLIRGGLPEGSSPTARLEVGSGRGRWRLTLPDGASDERTTDGLLRWLRRPT